MNLPHFALTHRSIIFLFVVILLIVGIFNFASMSRREDPEITIRDALIITSWPGASAERVEELITEPIEKVLIQIAEVDTVKSKSMVGFSVVQVTAGDRITNTDQVWDDVRAKVQSVQSELPSGASNSFVNSDFGDVYEVALALYQTSDPNQSETEKIYTPRELEVFAERVEEEIELITSVARVEMWGVQPERVYVEVDSSDWAKLGITASELRNLFIARNIVLPGGEFDTKDGRYAINPTGEFTSVDQMKELIIGRVQENLPVRIGDLPIRIDRRYEEPPRTLTRFTSPQNHHQTSIVLGISMKSGNNVVNMGQEIERVVARLKENELPDDIALTRVNDLPRQVNSRITDFQFNLLQGVTIVLVVSFFAMGWRPALIMATAVPLSMVAAFAVVRFFGIELEQFSIASLIIALGMVVDNAIVVSDNAVRLLREGKPKFEAFVEAAQGLAIPILTSTLTTIVAFLPMLTIVGNVGEYVASLPVVVTATLVASYFVAMLVTPIMCMWLLKAPEPDTGSSKWNFLERYDQLIHWCLDNKGKVLAIAGVLFLSSLLLIPIIGSQFFPAGARDQFFIKVWLPEGSTITQTSKVAKEVESVLLEHSPVSNEEDSKHRLQNIITFIGTGGPRLMLTQEPEYDYPYYALLLVNTTDERYTEEYAQVVRKLITDRHDARITVDLFMLGPPVKDAVAFRLSGPSREVIQSKAHEMVKLFKQTPGTIRPYSNWGSPSYQVDVHIDPYAANLAGITNADVAFTTNMLLSGAPLTVYREGDHKVPVMLRTMREKRQDLSNLSDIYVNGQFGKVPLNSIAEVTTSWQPAVIARRDRIPTVTVGARVQGGLLSNTVANEIKPKLEKMLETLPSTYFLEQGGELEETAKAQIQVVRAVGIAMVLMILVLTVQYNSIVKPIIILFSVPMAMIGVLVGLLVTGWALGFMAMLGILSLGGIVINNAIILIDFIETNLKKGLDFKTAVATAGRMRMRPIILTTLTTIGGLLPLSLFGGALWAPMTNGMIFGLIFSTALTLIVTPTFYSMLYEKSGSKVLEQA